MTIKKVGAAWLKAKAGILNLHDLVLVRIVHRNWKEFWNQYECPCGGSDHYASLPYIISGYSSGLGAVLSCYETNQQWLIRRPDIAGMIRKEEQGYFKLLKSGPAIVRKIVKKLGWSEETIAFLKDTHGIDRDLAELVHEGM